MQQTGRIRWLIVAGCFFLDVFVSQIVYGVIFGLNPSLATADLFATTPGIALWVMGWLLTALAGGLAGYLAREERFLHGFLVGGLGIVFLLLLALGGEQLGLDSLVGTLLAAPLAGLAAQLSGRFPARQRK